MNPAGPIFALLSAAFWGSGDFFGGLASRVGSLRPTLVLSQAFGVLLALCLVPFAGEGMPTGEGFAWAAAAGVKADGIRRVLPGPRGSSYTARRTSRPALGGRSPRSNDQRGEKGNEQQRMRHRKNLERQKGGAVYRDGTAVHGLLLGRKGGQTVNSR